MFTHRRRRDGDLQSFYTTWFESSPVSSKLVVLHAMVVVAVMHH
jgi:hypothetical protein